MKTKAAVLYKLNQPLVIEEIEIPKLNAGQVLVKMLFSGICRSQLNEIKGLKGKDNFLPHLLGHEASGKVETTGQGVTKVKKNDHVVLSWIKGRGHNVGSAKYLNGSQKINSGAIATFSQFAVVSENRLTPINHRIPPDIVALFGCALATGSGVVLHTLNADPKSTIAIFGTGGIGSGAILGASLNKCSVIIAVDIHKSALELAKRLGATHAVLFSDGVLDKIDQIVAGGVDFAVEASGNAAAMESAFAAIKNTGTLAICGNVHKDKKIKLDPFDFIKGKKIVGSWGGHTAPDTDFPSFARSYLKGDLPLKQLIGHKYRLNDINSALKDLEKNKYPGRLLIDFTSG